MILVVDNYDSFTYNLVQMLASVGADVRVYRNDAIDAAAVLDMRPAGVVISPGPCGPEQSGNAPDILRACASREVPLLGVCLNRPPHAI